MAIYGNIPRWPNSLPLPGKLSCGGSYPTGTYGEDKAIKANGSLIAIVLHTGDEVRTNEIAERIVRLWNEDAERQNQAAIQLDAPKTRRKRNSAAGGHARAKSLTPGRRSAIAKKAARARWGKK